MDYYNSQRDDIIEVICPFCQEQFGTRIFPTGNPEYIPGFGDEKICACGHTYYRHFDTYDDMNPIGCKYCSCETFRESNMKKRVRYANVVEESYEFSLDEIKGLLLSHLNKSPLAQDCTLELEEESVRLVCKNEQTVQPSPNSCCSSYGSSGGGGHD